jgi:hypothetical protein
MRRALLKALTAAAILVCADAHAQKSSLTVTGSAEVKEGNFAEAKAQGLEDAYQKALTQWLTQTLGQKVFQDKKALIDEYFLKEPGQFINRYRIVSENFSGDTYNVNAEIDLAVDKIQIGLVQAGLDRSKSQSLVLVVIEEEDGKYQSGWLLSNPSQSLAEKLLGLEIQRWGYRLVKPEPSMDPEKFDKYLADKSWQSQLGDRRNAKFMVLGQAKLVIARKEQSASAKDQLKTSEDAGTGTYTASASVSITVLDLDNGEKQSIPLIEQSAAANELVEARAKATDLAVRIALPEISLALDRLNRKTKTSLDKTQKILVEIQGVESYFQYQEIMAGFKNAESIRAFELWGFAPQKVKLLIADQDRENLKKQISSIHFPEFRLLPIESDKQDLRFKLEPIR